MPTTPTTNYAVDLSNLFLGYADFISQIPVASVTSAENSSTGALTGSSYTQNFYSVQSNVSNPPVFIINASGSTSTGTNTLFITVRNGYTMTIAIDGVIQPILNAGTYTFGPGLVANQTNTFIYLTVTNIGSV